MVAIICSKLPLTAKSREINRKILIIPLHESQSLLIFSDLVFFPFFRKGTIVVWKRKAMEGGNSLHTKNDITCISWIRILRAKDIKSGLVLKLSFYGFFFNIHFVILVLFMWSDEIMNFVTLGVMLVSAEHNFKSSIILLAYISVYSCNSTRVIAKW